MAISATTTTARRHGLDEGGAAEREKARGVGGSPMGSSHAVDVEASPSASAALSATGASATGASATGASATGASATGGSAGAISVEGGSASGTSAIEAVSSGTSAAAAPSSVRASSRAGGPPSTSATVPFSEAGVGVSTGGGSSSTTVDAPT